MWHAMRLCCAAQCKGKNQQSPKPMLASAPQKGRTNPTTPFFFCPCSYSCSIPPALPPPPVPPRGAIQVVNVEHVDALPDQDVPDVVPQAARPAGHGPV